MATLTAFFVVDQVSPSEDPEEDWGLLRLTPDPARELDNAPWAGTDPAGGLLKLTPDKATLSQYTEGQAVTVTIETA